MYADHDVGAIFSCGFLLRVKHGPENSLFDFDGLAFLIDLNFVEFYYDLGGLSHPRLLWRVFSYVWRIGIGWVATPCGQDRP